MSRHTTNHGDLSKDEFVSFAREGAIAETLERRQNLRARETLLEAAFPGITREVDERDGSQWRATSARPTGLVMATLEPRRVGRPRKAAKPNGAPKKPDYSAAVAKRRDTMLKKYGVATPNELLQRRRQERFASADQL